MDFMLARRSAEVILHVTTQQRNLSGYTSFAVFSFVAWRELTDTAGISLSGFTDIEFPTVVLAESCCESTGVIKTKTATTRQIMAGKCLAEMIRNNDTIKKDLRKNIRINEFILLFIL